MSSIYSDYMLVNFDSSQKWDGEFLRALDIYVQETPAYIRTNTNEIVHWRQQYPRLYPDDALFLFGIYNSSRLIGFCEAVFIRREALVIVDYMCIDRASRKNNVFFQFVEMARVWLEEQKYHFDYIVTEISLPDDASQSKRGAALIRALQMAGFSPLEINYKHPRLGDNVDTEPKAKLLIRPAHEQATISKGKVASIIKVIYEDHYARWYKGVLSTSDYGLYVREIGSPLSSLNSELQRPDERIPLLHLEGLENGADAIIGTMTQKQVFGYFFLAPFAVAASSAGGLLYMKSKLGISASEIVAIVLVSVVATVALMAFALKRSVSTAIGLIKAILGFFQK